MKERLFLDSLADIIVCQLNNNSMHPKMERDMVVNGNFHRRVFNADRLFRMAAENYKADSVKGEHCRNYQKN